VVNERSGCLDLSERIKKYPIAKTHFNMNKFSRPGEEDFLMVKEVVEDMADDARTQATVQAISTRKHSPTLPHSIDPQVTSTPKRIVSIPRIQSTYGRGVSTAIMSLQKELVKAGDGKTYPKKGDTVTIKFVIPLL
jgi:hypothetical protein